MAFLVFALCMLSALVDGQYLIGGLGGLGGLGGGIGLGLGNAGLLGRTVGGDYCKGVANGVEFMLSACEKCKCDVAAATAKVAAGRAGASTYTCSNVCTRNLLTGLLNSNGLVGTGGALAAKCSDSCLLANKVVDPRCPAGLAQSGMEKLPNGCHCPVRKCVGVIGGLGGLGGFGGVGALGGLGGLGGIGGLGGFGGIGALGGIGLNGIYGLGAFGGLGLNGLPYGGVGNLGGIGTLGDGVTVAVTPAGSTYVGGLGNVYAGGLGNAYYAGGLGSPYYAGGLGALSYGGDILGTGALVGGLGAFPVGGLGTSFLYSAETGEYEGDEEEQ